MCTEYSLVTDLVSTRLVLNNRRHWLQWCHSTGESVIFAFEWTLLCLLFLSEQSRLVVVILGSRPTFLLDMPLCPTQMFNPFVVLFYKENTVLDFQKTVSQKPHRMIDKSEQPITTLVFFHWQRTKTSGLLINHQVLSFTTIQIW